MAIDLDNEFAQGRLIWIKKTRDPWRNMKNC